MYKKSLTKPSKLVKFTEACWRFVYYLGIWIYGIVILTEKDWFWNTENCWVNFPRHYVTDDLYWYYTIELSFNLSLLVTQFFDVKRKDFWQMFLHHVVTISLMSFSYMTNMHRIGCLILLVHDW